MHYSNRRLKGGSRRWGRASVYSPRHRECEGLGGTNILVHYQNRRPLACTTINNDKHKEYCGEKGGGGEWFHRPLLVMAKSFNSILKLRAF